MADKTLSETLILLIRDSRLVPEEVLAEAIGHAKKLDIPLERALMMDGKTPESSLKSALRAQRLIKEGTITVDHAVNAMRLAAQQGIDLEGALYALRNLHQRTQTVSTLGSEIGVLLLTSGTITQEQLGRAVLQSQETNIPIGRTLRLNREISTQMLNAILNGQLLLRDKKADKQQVIAGLKLAHKNKCSIEQALFEMGIYKQPGDNELKLTDLFAMSGLISDSDRLECLELELLKQKQTGQLLLEQGLVEQELLEAAVQLQGTIGTGSLKPFQAAEALKRVALEKINIYQAIGELQPPAGFATPAIRLGQLAIEANFATAAAIDQAVSQNQDKNLKIGRVLLTAGVLTKVRLVNALRCQSLSRFGIISNVQAIAALRNTDRNQTTLDEAFTNLGWYVPTSMQWSWV